MPRAKQGARVLGPYKEVSGGITKWRVIAIGESGKRRRKLFDSRDEAAEFIASTEKRLATQDSVGETIEAYQEYLLVEKGNKVRSVETTIGRLEAWFPDDVSLASLTPEAIQQRYDLRRGEVKSNDTHRNELAEVKTFFRWCKKAGLVESNPALEVEPVGARSAGKDKLRLDEARRWIDTASELALTQPGAVAAMLSLILGMRATEIIERQVRDVDDGGRLLWVPKGKTPNARRKIEIPDGYGLREGLARLRHGKEPADLLFGYHYRKWPCTWVHRICEAAGVPETTAHGMRGLHGELGVDAGISAHVVAATLGQVGTRVLKRHYAGEEAFQRAAGRRAIKVLKGGKK